MNAYSIGIHIHTHTHVYIYIYIYQPLYMSRYFEWSLADFNSEFSFSQTGYIYLCPTILPIANGRIVGFINFPRILM